MPIYLGTSKINDLFLGTSKIKEIYLGTQKIYSSSSFPEGYVRYDNLLLTESANAKIDTKIAMNIYTRTVMDISILGGITSGVKRLWGHAATSKINVFYDYTLNGTESRGYGIGGYSTSSALDSYLPQVADVRHNLVITKDNSSIRVAVGDNYIETTSASNTAIIKLGTSYSSSIAGQQRLYGAKIYDANNKLIRDLVPAMKKEGSVVGLVNVAYDADDDTTGDLWYPEVTAYSGAILPQYSRPLGQYLIRNGADVGWTGLGVYWKSHSSQSQSGYAKTIPTATKDGDHISLTATYTATHCNCLWVSPYLDLTGYTKINFRVGLSITSDTATSSVTSCIIKMGLYKYDMALKGTNYITTQGTDSTEEISGAIEYAIRTYSIPITATSTGYANGVCAYIGWQEKSNSVITMNVYDVWLSND